MTAPGVEHSLAPESSDGFASVGTASHRKRVALLPGGPFCLWKTSAGMCLTGPIRDRGDARCGEADRRGRRKGTGGVTLCAGKVSRLGCRAIS